MENRESTMTNEEALEVVQELANAAALIHAPDAPPKIRAMVSATSVQNSEALRIVLELARQVDGLCGHMKSIRAIEEYVAGRKCACSGVGCVQCIARVALDGGELIS